MPTVIRGKFTLEEVIKRTYDEWENRFDFYKRDLVKRITIKEVKTYTPDRLNVPTTKYVVETKSWPQYRPYYTAKDSRGRPRKYQRTTSHTYDTVMQFDRLSVKTRNWKARVGSGRKWNSRPSQSQIHSIYRDNLKRWSKEKIAAHRKKKHKYLDVGDYNAQVNGINGDFAFRCSHAYWKHGHLFGNSYKKEEVSQWNPRAEVFLPKHLINILTILMQKGILSRD